MSLTRVSGSDLKNYHAVVAQLREQAQKLFAGLW